MAAETPLDGSLFEIGWSATRNHRRMNDMPTIERRRLQMLHDLTKSNGCATTEARR